MRSLALLLLLAACASTPPELRGAQFYFDQGTRDLERRRYLDAVENFQRIVNNYPGYARVAEAQYHLAEAYYRLGEYVNAVFEYERLVDTYPSSKWRVEAQYKMAESYYEQSRRAELDQSETYLALAAYRNFIEDNRGSPLVADAQARVTELRARLAKKDFLAGRLYQRQRHLKAARMTYEQLLRSYPDTDWYWHGLAQLGYIDRRQGDVVAARERWDEVLQGDCQDTELLRDVREWLAELDTK